MRVHAWLLRKQRLFCDCYAVQQQQLARQSIVQSLALPKPDELRSVMTHERTLRAQRFCISGPSILIALLYSKIFCLLHES